MSTKDSHKEPKKPEVEEILSEYFTSREDLFKRLDQETDVFREPTIRKAFLDINRADFIPADYKVESYEDYPLPIGFDQTISQPTTVAFMLELLGARPGDSVLDIGSGSGWTTALLASIVGKEGKVLGFEVIPELVMFGTENLAKYSFEYAEIRQAGKKIGASGETFDRILVNAAADSVSNELIKQLKIGGVLVMPIKDSIWRFEKKSEKDVVSKEYPGFSFVPLV